MSKQLPNNREEAFVYQFEDDIKMLKSLCNLSKDGFKKHLSILQAHIDAYNNKELQKKCQEAEEKHLKTKEFLINKFGYI